MNNHGGSRTPGPGKSLGPPTKHGVAKVPISGRVTPEVADYLRATGNMSETIEGAARRSKAFRQSQTAASDLPESTWSSLTDGKQQTWVAGVDFIEGRQNHIRSQSHGQAAARGFRSRTRARGLNVVIQWFRL